MSHLLWNDKLIIIIEDSLAQYGQWTVVCPEEERTFVVDGDYVHPNWFYLAKATKMRRGPMMGLSNRQQLGAVQRQLATRGNWLLTRFKLQLAALVPCHRLTATETHWVVECVRVKIDPVVGAGCHRVLGSECSIMAAVQCPELDRPGYLVV